MSPLVSILIPAFNARRWVKSSVESALNQSWRNKEIIVVDDGSTDNTPQILKGFSSKIVKVVTQENRGAAAARNTALSYAQGDFIQWLDADDLLAETKIETQLADSQNRHDTRTLYSCAWGRFFHRPEAAKFYRDPLWTDLTPVKWLSISLGSAIMMHPAAWLISRELSTLAGPWDERLSLNDDGEYFCRVVAASKYVKFCEGARCFYRIGNPSSLSFSRSGKSVQAYFLAVDLCKKHLLELEDSNDTRQACISLYSQLFAELYPEEENFAHLAQLRIAELGGRISPPRESQAFSLTKRAIGPKMAKRVRFVLWRIKTETESAIDWLLFLLAGKLR